MIIVPVFGDIQLLWSQATRQRKIMYHKGDEGGLLADMSTAVVSTPLWHAHMSSLLKKAPPSLQYLGFYCTRSRTTETPNDRKRSTPASKCNAKRTGYERVQQNRTAPKTIRTKLEHEKEKNIKHIVNKNIPK